MRIKGHRITTKEMYQVYKSMYGDDALKFNDFKEIIRAVYKEAVEECLKGGEFSFGSHVGTLSVKQAEKKFKLDENGNVKNLKPNYNETRKLREKGDETTVVYWTESIYYKWHFCKKKSNLKNKSVWAFYPTTGPIGVSRKIPAYLKANPRAHLNYTKLGNGS